jgi:hypothetical protein
MPGCDVGAQPRSKNPDSLPQQLAPGKLSETDLIYEVVNTGSIPLQKDNNLWISAKNYAIDTKEQALCLYIETHADVKIGLGEQVKAWNRSWQQFTFDKTTENIISKQTREEKYTSTDVEWWKWLVAALMGPLGLRIEGVTVAIVEGNAPNLGGTFTSIGKNLLQWLEQKTVMLKKIKAPNHVVISLDVDFHPA